LLDAAAPGTRAAALPDFKPLHGSPGFFDEGGLTARREGNAWLIAEQGISVTQRLGLLRHLTALVKLGSLVPASGGAPEVGQGNAPPPAHPAKLRVAPALEAGALGWEYLQTEAGGGGSGSCCGPLTHPAQLLGTSGSGSGPWSTGTVITAPTVAAVSVEGRAPVPTRSDGLPYGMRYAALPVRSSNVANVKPVAFNARGQRITTAGVEPTPKRHQFEGAYAPRAWTAPSTPPAAPCELNASGLSGLSPVGGDVVLHVKGYRMFETRAFQSCTDTYYTLGSSTLEAAILLDAEHPGATPAALPSITPAPGAAGVFDAPGGIIRGGHSGSNNLTAERLPGGWLVVTAGSGAAQQLQLLRRLHATIHL